MYALNDRSMYAVFTDDEMDAWHGIDGAFWAAVTGFSEVTRHDARLKNEAADTKSDMIEALRRTAMEAAQFFSHDPVVLKGKDRMVSSLVKLAGANDEPALLEMAAIICASAGRYLTPGRADGPGHGGAVVQAGWLPAREFWEALDGSDPAVLGQVHSAGEASKRLGAAAAAVLRGAPSTPDQLVDKVRIAAHVGVLKLVGASLSGPDDNREITYAVLADQMIRVRVAANSDCLAAIENPRSWGDFTHDVAPMVAARKIDPRSQVKLALGASGEEWRLSIWCDAQRLGVAVRGVAAVA